TWCEAPEIINHWQRPAGGKSAGELPWPKYRHERTQCNHEHGGGLRNDIGNLTRIGVRVSYIDAVNQHAVVRQIVVQCKPQRPYAPRGIHRAVGEARE